MNKDIAKIELIVQKIILFIWQTWGMLALLFLIYAFWCTVDEYKLLVFPFGTIISVTLYIWFLKILKLKLQNTKKYLETLVLGIKKESDFQISKIKKSILIFAFTFKILLALIWFTAILMGFVGFLSIILPGTNEEYNNPLDAFIIGYLIGNALYFALSYSIVDAISSIRILIENRHLNKLNKICLISSYLPILYVIIVNTLFT